MGRSILAGILVSVPLILFAFEGRSQTAKTDSLLLVLEDSGDIRIQIETAIALSREIHSSAHDEEKEYHFAQLALDKSETFGDTLLWAKALDNLGLLYRYHELFARSVSLHVRALELVEEKEVDPYYKMRFANNAGVAARYQQALDQAAHYYLKALAIAEKEGDLRNVAISSNGLGNTLSQLQGREREALQFFNMALEAEEKRENTLGLAINYLSIADYYTQMAAYDSARHYLDTLLTINQQREDAFGIAMTYEYHGHNLMAEGRDLYAARNFYDKALALFKSQGNKTKESQMIKNLGDIALRHGNTDAAKRLFENALSIAEDLANLPMIVSTSQALSEIHENLGNFRQALRFHQAAQTYRDSINLTRQETEIAAMKMDYDFQKKEAEIELLKKDQVLQEAALATEREKSRRQRAILAFLIITVIGATLLVIQFIKTLNIKKNTKILLQEQEKRRLKTVYENNLLQAEILASRMQMNPHFLFNCLNSIKFLIQTGTYKEAIKYLTTFSRFVREILESGKKNSISLKEELELIKKYVALEKNRFDHDLQFEIILHNVGETTFNEVEIPPMLLQPFIENAIWHGLLPSKNQEKKLVLGIMQKGQDVVIRITDNGVGRGTNGGNSLHESMGTKITQERITLFNKYKDKKISFGFEDLKHKDGTPLGTRVNVHLGRALSLHSNQNLVMT
jgi:tetratricopeptide (TPR) repeat protein